MFSLAKNTVEDISGPKTDEVYTDGQEKWTFIFQQINIRLSEMLLGILSNSKFPPKCVNLTVES